MIRITTALFIIACLVLVQRAYTQGCVAIKNITGFGQFAELGYSQQTTDKWALDYSTRVFEAYTFLAGTKNITAKPLPTGVTLHEVTNNFELTRLLTQGWSISLDMPIDANSTDGELEHASGDFHTTHSYGLGDIRLTAFKWLLNESARGNIQVGLGLKFSTGDYHFEDYFWDNPNDKTYKELLPVNVAIQLGDGGTGITTQVNAYYNFSPHFNVYGNFFYLISPRDQDGVASWPPNLFPPATYQVFHQATYDVNSVPDNYSLRAGGNFLLGNWVLTAGLRFEGVPAHDLIGADDGLRRAGNILSVEPGIQYKFKKSFLYAFFGQPLSRKTIITVPDERIAAITDSPVSPTPGHFANYLVYFGYSFTF